VFFAKQFNHASQAVKTKHFTLVTSESETVNGEEPEMPIESF